MIRKLFFTLLLISSQIIFAQKGDYKSQIQKHRSDLNAYYKNPKTSPLPRKQLKTFTGLPFYKIDSKYTVKAKLQYTFNSPLITIKSTKGESESYQKYAIAKFTIDGKDVTLNIYQSLSLRNKPGYQNYLFIPFKDATNGLETYATGRFLDAYIPETPTGYITLDFNKAYNPYCAYNKKFICPIPPEENKLPIAIKAGVKY